MQFPMETRIVGLVKNNDNEAFIFGENKKYIIPEYQREYSWRESQIESFIASVKHAIEGENVFMGTVQFACESALPNTLHVIDGQQRMTTFLLLCYILEKISGVGLLHKNQMSLDIRNFESNNDKLIAALNVEYADIENIKSDNNRYIENMQLLKTAVEELLQMYPIEKILTAVVEKMYFVELVTKDIPLPQVVGIFNTINTTGLDLNCSDLFKLQYYEYLKKNYPDKDDLMRDICEVYETVNKEEYNMQDILDIYKHCIVAKHRLGWEMLSKSNETFFEEIFGKKEPKEKAEILKFDEFRKIVTIYLDFSKKVYDNKSINAFATDVIWMTRYGRYWTLPYVAAYFNGKNYEKALEDAMDIAKYLIVCSVNFDKVINPVQTFMCNKILPALSRCEEIKEKIQEVICEAPYDWKSEWPEWGKIKFKERIKQDLFYNGKRAYIVCTLSALLEEIDEKSSVHDIDSKLFDWQNFKYDMEHICARKIFEKDYPESIAEYNGIGNLVVLNRSINRGIGDQVVGDKIKEYEDSPKYKYEKEPRFVSVKRVAIQIKEAGNVWGKEQVEARCKEQEKMLCEFLGLSD